MSVVYTYDNLNDLVWMGDNNIFEFLQAWGHIIQNLAIELGEQAKRDLMYKRMQASRKFDYDWNYYKQEKAKLLQLGKTPRITRSFPL